MARAQATTDHDVIRSWIESRKGHPAVVRATEGRRKGSAGLLRVDFNEPEPGLDAINWDDFFDTFDSNSLAFLYQEKTATGRKSRFHKFVSRDTVENVDEGATDSRRDAASGETRQASPAEEAEAAEQDEDDVEDDVDDDNEQSRH